LSAGKAAGSPLAALAVLDQRQACRSGRSDRRRAAVEHSSSGPLFRAGPSNRSGAAPVAAPPASLQDRPIAAQPARRAPPRRATTVQDPGPPPTGARGCSPAAPPSAAGQRIESGLTTSSRGLPRRSHLASRRPRFRCREGRHRARTEQISRERTPARQAVAAAAALHRCPVWSIRAGPQAEIG